MKRLRIAAAAIVGLAILTVGVVGGGLLPAELESMVGLAASQTYTLTVTPPTNGYITLKPFNPPGGTYPQKKCGTDGAQTFTECSASYQRGLVVDAIATAKTGVVFKSWSGACGTGVPGLVVSSDARCNLTMMGNYTAGATFGDPTLTISPPPSHGSVFLADNHYNLVLACGSISFAGVTDSCSTALSKGATISIPTASIWNPRLQPMSGTYVDTGYRFSEWSGACNGTGDCTLTMDSDKTISATFGPANSSLTITPPQNGVVTWASGACGATCSGSLAAGASNIQSLTATPAAGYAFASWGGDCSGQGMICKFNMSANRSVSVTFSPGVTLTVSPQPANGWVGVAYSGYRALACGVPFASEVASCSVALPKGANVSIPTGMAANPVIYPGSLAWAATGYRFSGWGGACSGTGDCNLTMDTDKTISATFSPQ